MTLKLFPAVIAAAALVLAPAAHADPASDDHFIEMLENTGMTWDDRQVVIQNGHSVCASLWAGELFDDQVAAVMAVETDLGEVGARTFVAIAVQAFCPDITARYMRPEAHS